MLRQADSNRERQMDKHTHAHTLKHSDCALSTVTVTESMTVTVLLWGYQ